MAVALWFSLAGAALPGNASANVQPNIPAQTVSGAQMDLSGQAADSLQAAFLPMLRAVEIVGKAKAPDINKLVNQFLVKASVYYDKSGFSSNHYTYTAAELRMLAIVIHIEAGNQPYQCKLAVGNVIMNRVLAPGYPGATIKDVVMRPNQFAYNASIVPDPECVKAARDVLDYEAWAVSQSTYFFRANSSNANWGSHAFFARLGNTAFYSDSYAGRSKNEAVPAKLYERVYKWPQYGCKPQARVRKLQVMLKTLGYKVAADGYYGKTTKEALMKFQTSKHLKADGVAGPATLKALIKKYGIAKFVKNFGQ